MTKKMKLNDIQYDRHDVLEVEIDVRPDNQVWDFGLLKKGKQIIEIHAANLPKLLSLTADEEELNDLRSSELRFNNLKSRVTKEINEKFGIGKEVEREKALLEFFNKNHPYKSFIEDYGREPKPIKSINVIENKGPRADDMVAAQKKSIDTSAQMTEVLSMLAKMLEKQEQSKTNNK